MENEVKLTIESESNSPTWAARELSKVIAEAIAAHAPFAGRDFHVGVAWDSYDDRSDTTAHNSSGFTVRFGEQSDIRF